MNGCILLSSLAIVGSACACLVLQRIWQRRFHSLQAEVARISDDLVQIVELQSEIYQRVCHDITDIEGKVLDLSLPSEETPLPLERRHQVLTLSKKGVGIDEIARRLNMPRGEAELIMNLRRYSDSQPTAPKRALA
jgi:hypothetical protein